MDRHEDDRLAVRSRNGDALALAQLYRRHAGSLLVYLQRYIGETADAEDILQETFVRILERRGRYESRGTFRAWLYTIATRLAADRVKQKHRRAEILSEQLAPITTRSTRDDPLERLHQHELIEQIRRVLCDLPPDYAAAFHLRVREGFCYREMSEILQAPAGTLRSRVHHAIMRVRSALAPPEPTLDEHRPSGHARTQSPMHLSGDKRVGSTPGSGNAASRVRDEHVPRGESCNDSETPE